MNARRGRDDQERGLAAIVSMASRERRSVSARRAAWLAWGGVGAYVVLAAAGLILELRAPPVDLPGDEESLGAVDVAIGLVLLVFTVVGALIASRRPRHPVGWLLLAIKGGVVADTMQPAHVSLWLRAPEAGR